MQATALASSRFDYETAERHVRAFREEQRASPLMQLYASFSLAQIAEVRGQLQEAEGYVLEAIAAAEEQGNNGMYMAGSVRIAFYDLWFRGDADAAVRRVEAALARHPLETIEPLERPYALLATFYALAGRTQRAEAYLAELERATDPILHEADGGPGVARGLVAMMDGRPEEGIAELRAADEGACSICILPVLGQAYDAAGEADSVIAVYERYVNTPWLDRLTAADWFALAGVYERLGGLYELRGDTEKAVLYYSRFVELWKDADPDLQVRVEAARRSIERLSGEI
jgi:tetratricopeptide (TPR) repeat protein